MDRRFAGANDLSQFPHGQISCRTLPAPGWADGDLSAAGSGPAGPGWELRHRSDPEEVTAPGSSEPLWQLLPTAGTAHSGTIFHFRCLLQVLMNSPSPELCTEGTEEGKPRVSEFPVPGRNLHQGRTPGSRATHSPGPGGCAGFAHVGVVFVCKSSNSCQELRCYSRN